MQADMLSRWESAMLEGDFESAWQVTDEIERDRRKPSGANGFQRHPCHLLWGGTAIDGRHVLVRCEHGLGDSVQFLRYLPLLGARAASVRVGLQPELKDLFP